MKYMQQLSFPDQNLKVDFLLLALTCLRFAAINISMFKTNILILKW